MVASPSNPIRIQVAAARGSEDYATT